MILEYTEYDLNTDNISSSLIEIPLRIDFPTTDHNSKEINR